MTDRPGTRRRDATQATGHPVLASRAVSLVVAGALALVTAWPESSPRAASPQPSSLPAGTAPPASATAIAPSALAPTSHPAVPSSLDEAWLVPAREPNPPAGYREFATGVQRLAEGAYGQALLLVSDARLTSTALAPYGAYYTALAYLRLSRPSEALALLDTFRGQPPAGFLSDAIVLARAEAAEALADWPAALRHYDELSRRPTATPDLILDRLARAAAAAGDQVRSEGALLKLYAEYPLSPLAPATADAVDALRATADSARRKELAALDLARAERLFTARRWAEAQDAFRPLLADASGETRELVDLRLAECDTQLGRHRSAIDRLARYLDGASRSAEARFFHLTALRALGNFAEYVGRVRELVEKFPESTWSEDALNALATHYILESDDESAASVFQQIVDTYSGSRHFERAAWKLGWWRYKNGDYAGAADLFEHAASIRPRADWRPAWVYWAGRARERLGQIDAAVARHELVATDYLNSYYGRLATDRLTALRKTGPRPTDATAEAGLLPADPLPNSSAAAELRGSPAAPANDTLIRALLSAGAYDLAVNELQYAQRAWGPNALVDATLAWIANQQGDLRRGINLMKRAYPHYIAAGGELLPADVLQVLFPVDYWESIRRYAQLRGLDPHVIAALIAQESTFDPVARSAANAWGLMQILPSTGRRLARAEGIRRFATGMLTDPDTNIRLGTRYFAGLSRQFGGAHFALASYNAGESRVVRWQAERPGLDRDEFIDDIPFPETQNYVKKILGTAEDYRRLYTTRRGASGAGGARTAPALQSDATNGASTPAVSGEKTGPKKPPRKIVPTKSSKKRAPSTASPRSRKRR